MTNLTTAEEGAKEPGLIIADRKLRDLTDRLRFWGESDPDTEFFDGDTLHSALSDCRDGSEAILAAEARAATAEAEVERLRAAHEPAVSAIMEANNSLYGSQGYFLSLNGGPPNKYHLANGIEDLKKRTRDDYVAKRAAESEAQALREKMVRLLIAFHDAIRRPLGVTPDSGAEFYDARLADEAEQRRAALSSQSVLRNLSQEERTARATALADVQRRAAAALRADPLPQETGGEG